MCNCIEEVNKKLSARKLNTQIKVPLLFDDSMNFTGSKVQIVTEKERSNVRKKPIAVFSSFCPFCGVAYNT